MATKIECDRCGKQWITGSKGNQQCQLSLNIPAGELEEWRRLDAATFGYDLCVNCAAYIRECIEQASRDAEEVASGFVQE